MRLAIIVKGEADDPFTAAYATGDVFTDDDELLVAELRRRGHVVEPLRWDNPSFRENPEVLKERYDLMLVRSPWDFLLRLTAFNAWLDAVESAELPLWNPPGTLRRNLSKRYLCELGEADVLTVPSRFASTPTELRAQLVAAEAEGWGEVVLKPAVSGGARGAGKFHLSEQDALLAHADSVLSEGELLLQPFFPEIQSRGEWSLVFFGDAFSHAVRKCPRPGEYREQANYGGQVLPDTPSSDLVAQADKARGVLASGLPYARVDGLERDGLLYINEVELIDPRLFFSTCPEAASRLATVLGAMRA